jgi:aspartate/methionine/tyrosine aminotransferase
MSAPHPERFLSARSRSVDSSGIRRVFDLGAQLKEPIDLSIGQPDFDVPESVRQAAINAIKSRKSGYTVTQGIAPLRERIGADLKAECGLSLPVLITSGVSGGILLSLMAVLDPGDEVVMGDPYFVINKHAVKLIGGTYQANQDAHRGDAEQSDGRDVDGHGASAGGRTGGTPRPDSGGGRDLQPAHI